MINEKVEIDVYGRKLTVEIEGLTQLEITSLAQNLSDKMKQIAKESEIVDSSKLAILTALETLAERARINTQEDNMRRAEERMLEHMIAGLQNALANAEAPAPPRRK